MILLYGASGGATFNGALTTAEDFFGMAVSANAEKTVATFNAADGLGLGAASSLTQKSSGKWYAAFQFDADTLPVAGLYGVFFGFVSTTFDANNAATTFYGNFIGLSETCGASNGWTFYGSNTTSTASSTPLSSGDQCLICVDCGANTFGIVTPDNTYHADLQDSLGTLSGQVSIVALLEADSAFPGTITLMKTSGTLTAPVGYQNIAV